MIYNTVINHAELIITLRWRLVSLVDQDFLCNMPHSRVFLNQVWAVFVVKVLFARNPIHDDFQFTILYLSINFKYTTKKSILQNENHQRGNGYLFVKQFWKIIQPHIQIYRIPGMSGVLFLWRLSPILVKTRLIVKVLVYISSYI